MSSDLPPIVDALAVLTDSETQRVCARLAQETFAGTFRQAVAAGSADAKQMLGEVADHCRAWCRAGGSEDAQALRLALLISGLDQWGLAYSQAFSLSAIPALSALIGALRTQLDAQADARFQRFYAEIEHVESNAIDFKIELRRSLHLALWHAMAACESEGEAEVIVQSLGSLLLALNERMPELGWRLVADALASIQLCLLGDAAATPVAQTGTQQLFESLRHSLAPDRYRVILAHSAQAVLAWQQTRRAD